MEVTRRTSRTRPRAGPLPEGREEVQRSRRDRAVQHEQRWQGPRRGRGRRWRRCCSSAVTCGWASPSAPPPASVEDRGSHPLRGHQRAEQRRGVGRARAGRRRGQEGRRTESAPRARPQAPLHGGLLAERRRHRWLRDPGSAKHYGTPAGKPVFDGYFPAAQAASATPLKAGTSVLPKFEYPVWPAVGVPVVNLEDQSGIMGFTAEPRPSSRPSSGRRSTSTSPRRRPVAPTPTRRATSTGSSRSRACRTHRVDVGCEGPRRRSPAPP